MAKGVEWAFKNPIRRELHLLGRNLFEYHPVIGYRFIPGLKARVRHESGGYLVRCNQAGFRSDHEATVEKPKNTFRIVVCGDSYTAGDGVSNGKRYTDVLENNFENLQVLNFGLPGSGTGQQFLAFKEYAAALDYDLLIICPMVENIIRVEAKARETMNSTDGDLVSRPKPYFELNDGQLELKNQPVPRETKPVVRGRRWRSRRRRERSQAGGAKNVRTLPVAKASGLPRARHSPSAAVRRSQQRRVGE